MRASRSLIRAPRSSDPFRPGSLRRSKAQVLQAAPGQAAARVVERVGAIRPARPARLPQRRPMRRRLLPAPAKWQKHAVSARQAAPRRRPVVAARPALALTTPPEARARSKAPPTTEPRELQAPRFWEHPTKNRRPADSTMAPVAPPAERWRQAIPNRSTTSSGLGRPAGRRPTREPATPTPNRREATPRSAQAGPVPGRVPLVAAVAQPAAVRAREALRLEARPMTAQAAQLSHPSSALPAAEPAGRTASRSAPRAAREAGAAPSTVAEEEARPRSVRPAASVRVSARPRSARPAAGVPMRPLREVPPTPVPDSRDWQRQAVALPAPPRWPGPTSAMPGRVGPRPGRLREEPRQSGRRGSVHVRPRAAPRSSRSRPDATPRQSAAETTAEPAARSCHACGAYG